MEEPNMMPAPKSGGAHKVLITLAILILLVAGVNLAVVLMGSDSPFVDDVDTVLTTDDVDIDDDMEDEDVCPEVEPCDLESTRTYSSNGVTFDYTTGWHVSGRYDFDDPYGVKKVYIRANKTPFVTVSPSEGVYSTVSMTSFQAGEAILASYEGLDWASYESDTVTINGKDVMRLRLTAGENLPYHPLFQEVLFIGGAGDIGLEVVHSYHDASDANDPEWEIIKNSLQIN